MRSYDHEHAPGEGLPVHHSSQQHDTEEKMGQEPLRPPQNEGLYRTTRGSREFVSSQFFLPGSERASDDRQQAASDVHAPASEPEEAADGGRTERRGGERQQTAPGQDGPHHAHKGQCGQREQLRAQEVWPKIYNILHPFVCAALVCVLLHVI